MSVIKRYNNNSWEVIGGGSSVGTYCTIYKLGIIIDDLETLINSKQASGNYVLNLGGNESIQSSTSPTIQPKVGDIWIDTSIDTIPINASMVYFEPTIDNTANNVQDAIINAYQSAGVKSQSTSSIPNSIAVFADSSGSIIKATPVTIDSNGVFSNLIFKYYQESERSFSNTSSSATIELSEGNIQRLTLTENVTSFIFPSLPPSGTVQSFVLKVIGNGTSTISWGGVNIKWMTYDGLAPTLAEQNGYISLLSFTSDLTNNRWLGFLGGIQV